MNPFEPQIPKEDHQAPSNTGRMFRDDAVAAGFSI